MTKYFFYRLTGTGWAEATFTSEKQSINFEVCYLSGPLSDLFEALYRLATGDFVCITEAAFAVVLGEVKRSHFFKCKQWLQAQAFCWLLQGPLHLTASYRRG